jgi:hypothetical protein
LQLQQVDGFRRVCTDRHELTLQIVAAAVERSKAFCTKLGFSFNLAQMARIAVGGAVDIPPQRWKIDHRRSKWDVQEARSGG